MYKLIFTHLNINSIRKKFELPINQISDTVDVLMISKTKTDILFPTANLYGSSQPFGQTESLPHQSDIN